MDMSGIVKMFHCYTRGEINVFQQARNTCSIVCVLRVYLVCVSDACTDRNPSNPPQLITKIILIHCVKTSV